MRPRLCMQVMRFWSQQLTKQMTVCSEDTLLSFSCWKLIVSASLFVHHCIAKDLLAAADVDREAGIIGQALEKNLVGKMAALMLSCLDHDGQHEAELMVSANAALERDSEFFLQFIFDHHS